MIQNHEEETHWALGNKFKLQLAGETSRLKSAGSREISRNTLHAVLLSFLEQLLIAQQEADQRNSHSENLCLTAQIHRKTQMES